MPNKGYLYERTTGEIVILMLAFVVVVTILMATVTVAVIEIVYPDQNTDETVRMINDTTNVILGAVIGYVAGRKEGLFDEPRPRVQP
jgi:P pilus assembly chaperone PapD